MVSITLLWLPVLLATVLVFVAGFVMNMILPHHRSDFSRLPDQEAVAEALRRQSAPQGQYIFPYAASPAEIKDPDYTDKVRQGPVGLLVLWPNIAGVNPKQLAQHFAYTLIICFTVGYLAGAALPAGSAYLKVFQITGTAALLGFSGGLFINSIWWHFSWSTIWKHAFDGLVYALLAAGVFAAFWPGS